jgi:hypothetical protein
MSEVAVLAEVTDARSRGFLTFKACGRLSYKISVQNLNRMALLKPRPNWSRALPQNDMRSTVFPQTQPLILVKML